MINQYKWGYLMNKKIDYLVMVSSWEERSILGCTEILQNHDVENAILFNYKEYYEPTANNRSELFKLFKNNNVKSKEIELSFYDPSGTWKILFKSIKKLRVGAKKILIDISTMPRDAIWTIIDLMKFNGAELSIVYHTPDTYSTKWLSRDHKKPQIVYKMGGITQIGKPTNLLIISGFDIERIVQIINCYEPQHVLMGVQEGRQFDNQSLNAERVRERFQTYRDFTIFPIDAYKEDHGLNAIETAILPYIEDSNIILNSLGPKMSALALYKIHEKYKHTSLAYTPSGQYNLEYSIGYKDTMYLEL